jgi:hypothetical protein
MAVPSCLPCAHGAAGVGFFGLQARARKTGGWLSLVGAWAGVLVAIACGAIGTLRFFGWISDFLQAST